LAATRAPTRHLPDGKRIYWPAALPEYVRRSGRDHKTKAYFRRSIAPAATPHQL
jgi:hypothetical protein